ncbi:MULTISPECIES: hypothetical protein [Bradyrhizobium]|uniref:Apea-like HEPN domain-containing protein n=2 Tax=Bradyrhizobium TaxID=374 RepID=A0ABY0QGC8_9BRAD|nr:MULTISPECIES: hypothetical protein [Bradyrhizobium]SDK27759.1 hypothetical protein SAMN05444163_7703 [Bradyrhizobium ottawaense]SEE42620.1 hypothetical protein SAMN05444171_7431 [Bradyrhizobium lablabi]
MTNSAQTKRGGRRYRAKQRGKLGVGRMNKAMGEFLTAQGRVELTMILLLMMMRDEDYEWIFDQMSEKPFGDKIKFFKKYTADESQFSPENLILRNQIYEDLDALLPQRNSIVHGETYEDQFKGRPKQSYRVGVIKNNIEYLEDYSMDKHGSNVFSVKQVQDATALANQTWRNINRIRGIEGSLWWD